MRDQPVLCLIATVRRVYARVASAAVCRVNVLSCLAAVLAAFAVFDLHGETIARWTLDDHAVGTVLVPGMVFKNKINPGTYDLVLRAVDPSQSAEANRPVVTNGFPSHLKWEPYFGSSTNCELEDVSCAVKFNGGGKKGYYLELADPTGALKTSNWTLEVFVRSVGGACAGTAISMPAMTDGTMVGTNSIAYTVPLSTWPGTFFLKDAGGGKYTYTNAGWNAGARGNMLQDIWFHIAVQCEAGTLHYRRDHAPMYQSTTWIQPDSAAPFILGGTLWGGDFTGCITEMRLSSRALPVQEMSRATTEGAPRGTTLLYARYEPGDGYHFTGELAKYYNVDSSGQATHNVKGIETTNDVQDVYVHPGYAMPAQFVKNLSSLVPTNLMYFGEYRSPPLNDLQNLTLECFVRVDEVTGTGDRLGIVQMSYYGGVAGTALWGLHVRPDGRLTATWVPYNLAAPGQYWASELVAPAGTAIDDGKWHHVALVVSVDCAAPRTTLTLYVDHVAKATSSYNGWLRVYSNGVARKWFVINGDKGWRGALDELRVSAGALDPQTEMLWQRRHGGTQIYFR